MIRRPIRGGTMAEPEAIEPLKIDAELWSHRDLLERIVCLLYTSDAADE